MIFPHVQAASFDFSPANGVSSGIFTQSSSTNCLGSTSKPCYTMTGKELFIWRTKEAQLTQGDLATVLSISQKTVSVNERSEIVTPSLAERVRELQKLPKDRWPKAASTGQQFSWPEDLFAYVWNAAPRRAAAVELKATFRAVEGSQTADCEIEICFTKLELDNNGFYFDHIGPLELDPTKEDHGWRVSTLPGGLKKATHNFTTILEETPEDLRESPPDTKPEHHRPRRGLAYRIQQVAPEQETRIFLKTTGPIPVAARDFIGFPVYSDLAIRELTIELRFEGLRIGRTGPGEEAPLAAVPRALTIRRTQFADEPSMVTPLDPQEVLAERSEENAQVVTLGPLHRPRGGHMYAIVWTQLKNFSA